MPKEEHWELKDQRDVREASALTKGRTLQAITVTDDTDYITFHLDNGDKVVVGSTIYNTVYLELNPEP